MASNERTLTTQQVAQILGNRPTSAARLMRVGQIKAKKRKNGRWAVLRADLDAYLLRRKPRGGRPFVD